jgi:hypothetical protein
MEPTAVWKTFTERALAPLLYTCAKVCNLSYRLHGPSVPVVLLERESANTLCTALSLMRWHWYPQELDGLDAECPACGPTHLGDIGHQRQIVAADSHYLLSDFGRILLSTRWVAHSSGMLM